MLFILEVTLTSVVSSALPHLFTFITGLSYQQLSFQIYRFLMNFEWVNILCSEFAPTDKGLIFLRYLSWAHRNCQLHSSYNLKNPAVFYKVSDAVLESPDSSSLLSSELLFFYLGMLPSSVLRIHATPKLEGSEGSSLCGTKIQNPQIYSE